MLTGHSLGGGLAGFIGSLTGAPSVGFDHMPFGLVTYIGAAAEAKARNGGVLPEHFSDVGMHVPQTSLLRGYFTNDEPLENVRNGSIQQTLGNLLSGVPGVGPFLQNLGLSIGTATEALENPVSKTGLPLFDADLEYIQKHSQALLVTLLFGKTEWESEHGTAWRAAAPFVLPALYRDHIALSLDLTQGNQPSLGHTGNAAPYDQMMRAIAYSAIDIGEGRPFGDTGIRALFDDASNLAVGVETENVSEALDRSESGVADLLVQYAGLLAVNAVRDADDANAKDGVLSVAPSGSALTLNLAPDSWTFGGTYRSPIGLNELINNAVGVGPNSVATTQYALSWYAEITNQQPSNIYELVGALSYQLAGGSPGTLTFLPDDGLAMFVLNDFNQIISSPSNQRDFIVGSAVADQINGGNGHDILIGNLGDDILDGGADGDLIIGGIGADTIRGGVSSGIAQPKTYRNIPTPLKARSVTTQFIKVATTIS